MDACDPAAIRRPGRFRFAIGRIGGPEGLPLIVSRTGYTGELARLWCHPGDAPALWDLVGEAGRTS